MPRLRGHHLICLHFFHGEGYDAPFVKNLISVLKKAEDSPVTIADGIDDVCRKCIHGRDDGCRYSEHSDNEIKAMDKRALDLIHAEPGAEVIWREIRERLPSIFRSWHESYCVACGWKKACEKNEAYRKIVHACAGNGRDL